MQGHKFSQVELFKIRVKKMKFAAATLILILFFSITDAADPFFGNKYKILLGQEKPGQYHAGITIKEEKNVAIETTNKADGCLNSWKFTAGYIYFAQDGSLDLATKSYTVGVFFYYSEDKVNTILSWSDGSYAPNTYLATFGTKFGGGDYQVIAKRSDLTLNTWYFVGYSVDYTKKKYVAWVDDFLDEKSFSSYSATMNGDIYISRYKSSDAPETTEMAGLTIFEGAIDTGDIKGQIATFRRDILKTLTPTCSIFTTTAAPTTASTTTLSLYTGQSGSTGLQVGMAMMTIALLLSAVLGE